MIELDPLSTVCDIDNEEDEVIKNLLYYTQTPLLGRPNPPVSYMDWQTPNWLGIDTNLDTFLSVQPPNVVTPTYQGVPKFVPKTRVFTERTGFANELQTNNPQDEAYLVPAQNLSPAVAAAYRNAGMATPIEDFLHDLSASNGAPMACQTWGYGAPPWSDAPEMLECLPRLSILDTVYPPVSLTYDDPANPNYPTEPDADITYRTVPDIATDLASRRYNWTAFHHKLSSEPTKQDMLLTVVVTHRADLNERYARQVDLDTSTPGYQADFNLTDDAHRESLFKPLADVDAATDTLFPRPWLVALGMVDLGTGEVRCAGEVARLLPAGSFFVVARTVWNSSGSQRIISAGTYYEVLESTWENTDFGASLSDLLDQDYWDDSSKNWASLKIPRSGSGGGYIVLAWVFPPAFDRTQNTFTGRSPIVTVAPELMSY